MKHKYNYLTVLGLLSLTSMSHAGTAITGIISDFNGFFQSELGSINPVSEAPNSAHDLLAFAVDTGPGGSRQFFSTSVDDSILTANGVTFNAGRYEAFVPISAESTLAGQGSLDDGDAGAFTGSIFGTPTPGATPGRFDVTPFLTDGERGLGLSTFANNVGGTFEFSLSGVDSSTFGDGIPDLIYFNQAGVSPEEIMFEFFDAAGMSLATHAVAENLGGNIATIQNDRFNQGTQSADASQTASNQAVQGFSVEFSDFAGLTQADLENAVQLSVILPAQADPPFIAFNSDAFNATAIPEPASTGLCIIGGMVACLRRRRTHASC